VRWADPEPKATSLPILKSPSLDLLNQSTKSLSPVLSIHSNKSTTTTNTLAVKSINSSLSICDDIDYTTLQDVTTICEIKLKPPAAQSCFGFVIDEERKLKGPYATPEWHKSFSPKVLTLDLLLQKAAQPPTSAVPMDNTTLFKLERITLAVNLASSLLQLYATPWFNERWSKSDILFLTNDAAINPGSRRPPRPVDIERPLLAQRFLPSGTITPSTNSTLPRPTHPNLSVLSLGIMLLELWFATPIEARRLPSDLVDGKPNSSTDLAVAERWVKENANLEDIPAGYWQAVSSCIYCFFQPMPRDKSLENPDFREAIWQNVVVPLERELQAWQYSA
jgi:hypothetical protein